MATTVTELVQHIRTRINELHGMVDVILDEYRVASDIIDHEIDRREIHLSQLEDLDRQLAEIVEQHPAMCVDKICQNAADVLVALALDHQHKQK